MKIKINRGSYNERRFGRPWIGKIMGWSNPRRPDIEWGNYFGSELGGVLEIEADPGDILRTGQRDHRTPSKTRSEWGLVEDDGFVRDISEDEARDLWNSRNTPDGRSAAIIRINKLMLEHGIKLSDLVRCK